MPALLVALTALIPSAEAAEPAAELPVTAQVPAFVGLDRSGAPLSESSPATLVSVTTGRAMDAQLKPRPAGALELTSALSPARRAAALQLGVSGAIAAGLESDVALVGAARLTYRRPDPAWNAPGLTVAAARVASFDGGQLDALGHDTTSVWLSGGLPLQPRVQLTLGLSGARSDADQLDRLATTARLRLALPGARLVVEGGAAVVRPYAIHSTPRPQANLTLGAELPVSQGSWVTADVGLSFDPRLNLVTFTQAVDVRWGVNAG